MEMKKGFCTWERSIEWSETVPQKNRGGRHSEEEGTIWRPDKGVVWGLRVVLRWAWRRSAVHGAALTAKPKRSLI